MGLFKRIFGGEDEDTEDSKPEEPEEVETYYYEFRCDNCSVDEELKIPSGIRVEDFLRGKKCKYCGCIFKGIKKENEKIID